jgi:hypothetical protein
MTDTQFKIVNTPLLELLIGDAMRQQFNRQLDPDRLLPVLDPEGIHVLHPFLLHGTESSVPHMRCRVMLKLKGQRLPAEGWLDVDLAKFNRLPTHKEEEAR